MSDTPAVLRRDLQRLAELPDDDIDLAEAALTLAALERHGADRAPYRAFLAGVRAEVAAAAGSRQPEACVAALNAVLVDRHRFHGDDRDDDDRDPANLMQTIDRKRGLGVAMGVLYLDAGRAQGWAMAGLNFPAHFLVRLDAADGRRLILDPFHGGRLLDAAALRELLKALTGAAAELQPALYSPIDNRDILIRLQNTIKLQLMRAGRMDQALACIETTLLFAPNHPPLWREAGMLHLRQGHLKPAIAALEQYVTRAPNTQARHRASVLLQELRQRLD